MTASLALIHSPHQSLDPMSALEKPPSILLGVSKSAANALDDVGISTVYPTFRSCIW